MTRSLSDIAAGWRKGAMPAPSRAQMLAAWETAGERAYGRYCDSKCVSFQRWRECRETREERWWAQVSGNLFAAQLRIHHEAAS